jgi:hypothetical protein
MRVKVCDGTVQDVDQYIQMPCGSTAEFDYDAGYGYYCWSCMSVIGSIAMPKQCNEEIDKYRALEALGGKGWDYKTGRQKT